jgi:ABC-type branched-subunit amino acid transport system substrate-binding protein
MVDRVVALVIARIPAVKADVAHGRSIAVGPCRRAARMADESAIQIGVLVPLTRPGWVEAGRHLLAGLELAAHEVNDAGGVAGRPLELVIRDTAGDPQRAAAAVDELSRRGVAALAGEYHSVVARAAATKADALGMPFLCSSAVLDALTEEPTEWVARLAPAQSCCWQIYADFLLGASHRRIAVATEPSVYWASGACILRDYLSPRGGTVVALDMRVRDPAALCEELVNNHATALLLLVGYPEPAASIVKSVRHDQRVNEVMIGAPAGQPEFAEWSKLLGDDGVAIPFLRYLPGQLSSLGSQVDTALRERLAEAPSFVAFEGYDTVAVLADMLRSHGADRARIAEAWPRVAVDGTRGQIQFCRKPGISVWQWAWPPIQVVARDQAERGRFRVLHAA